MAVGGEGTVRVWAAAPPAAIPEKAKFWARAIGFVLIDLIILRYVCTAIALFIVYAATGPEEVWILGGQDPADKPFVYAYGDCEPNPIKPVCYYYTDWDDIDTADTMWTTFNIVWLVGLFLYLWIGNAVGSTIGKALSGVEVVRKDSEEPLGPWRGLVRTLGYIPSSLFLGLGYLWAIWDKDKQTWHDKIAGSIVVPRER